MGSKPSKEMTAEMVALQQDLKNLTTVFAHNHVSVNILIQMQDTIISRKSNPSFII